MGSPDHLLVKAGPVPDKLTIWPVDDGRYGRDATFQGASGYQRAEHHPRELEQGMVPHKFRQELDGGGRCASGPSVPSTWPPLYPRSSTEPTKAGRGNTSTIPSFWRRGAGDNPEFG
jgi:hypothetical protein